MVYQLDTQNRVNTSPRGSDDGPLIKPMKTCKINKIPPIPKRNEMNCLAEITTEEPNQNMESGFYAENEPVPMIIDNGFPKPELDDSQNTTELGPDQSLTMNEETTEDSGMVIDDIPIEPIPSVSPDSPLLITGSPKFRKKISAKSRPPSRPSHSLFVSAANNVVVPIISIDDASRKLDGYLETGLLPDDEYEHPIINEIERRRLDAIESGDYEKAFNMDKLSMQIQQGYNNRRSQMSKDTRVQELQEKIEDAKNELYVKKKDWEQMIQIEKQKCTEEVYLLDAKHESDLKQFDQKWEDPNNLRLFSKPSQQLLQMRKVERTLVLQRSYQKASLTRKQADKIEKSETKINQQKALLDMKFQREKIIEQQDKERETIEIKIRQRMSVLNMKMRQDLEVLEKRVKKLEILMHQAKSGRVDIVNRPQTPPAECKLTPRTSSKLVEFRSSTYYKPLNIRPIQSTPTRKKRKRLRIDQIFHD